eukprot:evm.model.NODE_37437_length_30217_cov_24.682034.9
MLPDEGPEAIGVTSDKLGSMRVPVLVVLPPALPSPLINCSMLLSVKLIPTVPMASGRRLVAAKDNGDDGDERRVRDVRDDADDDAVVGLPDPSRSSSSAPERSESCSSVAREGSRLSEADVEALSRFSASWFRNNSGWLAWSPSLPSSSLSRSASAEPSVLSPIY